MRTAIERYWSAIITIAQTMPFGALVSAAEVLLECHALGKTVFILGNGGSAATASHFACDLAKGARVPGVAPFRVVPLTDNMPLITAWANDTSYDRVFAEQLAPLVRPGDVVIAISASGNSPNVLAVAPVAHANGATLIALTGKTGGKLARQADLAIRVPAQLIEQVEDAHMVICHSLCVVLREHLREHTQGAAVAEHAVLHGVSAAEPVQLDLLQ